MYKRYPGIVGLTYRVTPDGTHYKVGPFNYRVDGRDVMVMRDTETSFINIAMYTYRTTDEAEDRAWSMARKQARR